MTDSPSKANLYERLLRQLRALLEGETDFIANAANTAALGYHNLPDVNWAGFYLCRGGQLVLGPFQGKPACQRIALGRGVCGAAAGRKTTILVPNVCEFPDHIACDSASKSEIAVPLIGGGRLLGVFDVDSPTISRFDAADQRGIEAIVACFLKNSKCDNFFASVPDCD
ncbi:MAG: GAF domain-containing protein [Pirellulales bacterium]|nr:GAF domain-containing protein [Pirellulales bacterium]